MMSRASLLLACLVVAVAVVAVAGANSLTVVTDKGPVQGYSNTGVDKWRGIPYAAPPVGPLRFASPQDAPAWTSVLPTKSAAPICPQLKILGTWSGSEDCLYLNIYAPAGRDLSDPLPVMVWIYGGGWKFGDGIEFGLYDATNFVNAHNVIVVTFNYRLGPLGFMALSALKNENTDGRVGSWAIYDQLQALKWVSRNIRAFGGDPGQVTIAGESAGAFSSCIHVASPLSAGLFRGAIFESGTCKSEIFFASEEKSFAWSETFVEQIGCDPTASDEVLLSCIRGLDLKSVMGPSANMSWPGYVGLMFPDLPWSATIDGVLLKDTPFRMIQNGQFNRVPVLAGTNHDEGSLFVTSMVEMVPSASTPLVAGDLRRIMSHFFGGNTTVLDLVDATYPFSAFPNATEQCSQVIRDFFFLCPTSRVLLEFKAAGLDSWLYQFVYHGDWIEDESLGVYHSSELEFVFDNAFPPIIHSFSDRDQAMANSFGTYWSDFVRYLNPNGNSSTSSEPFWPGYEGATMSSMAMDVPPTAVQNLEESRCAMWDSISEWTPPVTKRHRKTKPTVVFE